MNLKDIALLNLRRRKAKAAFLLAGLLIGVTTVVALITLVDAMRTDITDKLDKFGANILIVPKTENLSLTYGGLSLGGVSFEMEEIYMAQLEAISTIKNAANVAAVGPVALGVVEVTDKKVLLAWPPYNRGRIDSIPAMIHMLYLEDRIVMLQRVITVMVAKRALRLPDMRGNNSSKRKFGLGHQRMAAMWIFRHLKFFPQQQ